MTDDTQTGQDDDTCEEEYNCEGYMKGHIRLHCECNCPEPQQYVTKVHPLPCDVKELHVATSVQNYLTANPLYQLLSVLDIGHAGWLLILRVPV